MLAMYLSKVEIKFYKLAGYVFSEYCSVSFLAKINPKIQN